MSDTELLPKSKTEAVRRLEVFTGADRRRAWIAEEKDRIVAESYTCGESVSVVSRRHGLTPQQLFAWRRNARHPAGVDAVGRHLTQTFNFAVCSHRVPALVCARNIGDQGWSAALPDAPAAVRPFDRVRRDIDAEHQDHCRLRNAGYRNHARPCAGMADASCYDGRPVRRRRPARRGRTAFGLAAESDP